MINWPIDFPSISTEPQSNIKLRPLRESDIAPIYQACQDPIISEFTRVPSPYELSMAEDFVRESDIAYRNHISASFAIELVAADFPDGVFVGTIGLHSLQLSDHLAEVGYWMDSRFRGRGICTQAMKALSEFSFSVMGFRRLEALADFDNIASQKVMAGAGYERTALLKNRVTKRDGSQKDMVLYSKIAQ